MEIEPKKTDYDINDDSEDDSKDGANKKSKKIAIKKSDLAYKKSSYFRSKQTDDKELEKDENLSQEELSENEVHEAVLAIADTRMQDVSEKLDAAPDNSSEEFVEMSSAIFLDSIAIRATTNDDFTEADIEASYQETLQDLNPEYENSILEVETNTENADPNINKVSFSHGQDYSNETNQNTNTQNLATVMVADIGYSNENLNSASRPETNDVYDAYIPRSDMLLGVVVGYIVGRRGGRIRAEKKYIPKINSLEKQISEITNNILKKEELIRRQSREIYEKSFVKPNNPQAVIERRKVRIQVNEQLRRRQELLNDPSVEKIGKFSLPALKIYHERRLIEDTENKKQRKSFESMSIDELLGYVIGLKVNKISVYESYKNGRLTEKALRQIVIEFYRGGNYEKTFYKELGPDPETTGSIREKINLEHDQSKSSDKSYFNKDDTIEKPQNIIKNDLNDQTSPLETKQDYKNKTKLLYIVGLFVILILIYLLLR